MRGRWITNINKGVFLHMRENLFSKPLMQMTGIIVPSLKRSAYRDLVQCVI